MARPLIKKLLGVVILGLLAAPALRADAGGAAGRAVADKQWDKAPKMAIDVNKKYTATLDTTKGKIVIDLFAKDAPVTVNNFVFLSRENFYNGIVFHRVIPDFMVQTGDPTGTGAGGPGYSIPDEAKNNPHKHDRGALSMAKTAEPDSGGSQFFICHNREGTAHLDGIHTVFGHVRAGMDVVDAIRKGDKINGVTIEEQ